MKRPGRRPQLGARAAAGDTLACGWLGAILSASSVIARIERGDQFFYFKRQIIWAVLGVGVLIIAIRIPYRLYKKYSGLIFGYR